MERRPSCHCSDSFQPLGELISERAVHHLVSAWSSLRPRVTASIIKHRPLALTYCTHINYASLDNSRSNPSFLSLPPWQWYRPSSTGILRVTVAFIRCQISKTATPGWNISTYSFPYWLKDILTSSKGGLANPQQHWHCVNVKLLSRVTNWPSETSMKAHLYWMAQA